MDVRAIDSQRDPVPGAWLVMQPEKKSPRPGGDPLSDQSVTARNLIEILYRRQSAGLFRLFVRKTANRDEASDFVQELFSRLASASETNGIERPEAYLNRLARNLLADRQRRHRSRPIAVPLEPDDGLHFSDPVRLLESRDMLNRLELAMAKLKPKTRAIFMAHRLDGMSYAEIAEKMGMSIKGIEKQMSKAIAQIDRMLDKG